MINKKLLEVSIAVAAVWAASASQDPRDRDTLGLTVSPNPQKLEKVPCKTSKTWLSGRVVGGLHETRGFSYYYILYLQNATRCLQNQL